MDESLVVATVRIRALNSGCSPPIFAVRDGHADSSVCCISDLSIIFLLD